MLMEDDNELEDGEIEEVSDMELLPRDTTVQNDMNHPAPINNNAYPVHGVPTFSQSQHQLFGPWREYQNKNKKQRFGHHNWGHNQFNKKDNLLNKDTAKYDLDDYELLLARHQLIQQQLEKVNAQDTQTTKGSSIRKNKRSQGKKTKKSKAKDSAKKNSDHFIDENQTIDNLACQGEAENTTFIKNNEFQQNTPVFSPNIILLSDNSPIESQNDIDDDDVELKELRKALLAQTSKRKHKEELRNEPLKETNTNSAGFRGEDRLSTRSKVNIENNTEKANLNDDFDHETTPSVLRKVEFKERKIMPLIDEKPVSAGIEESTKYFGQMLKPKVDFIQIDDASGEDTGDVKGPNDVMNGPPNRPTYLFIDTSVKNLNSTFGADSNLCLKLPDDDENGHKVLTNNQKKSKRTVQLRLRTQPAATRVVTRSQAGKTSNRKVKVISDGFQATTHVHPPSRKRRRRGGRRSKLLAFRAQEKKELEILQHQQEVAFDNYSSVPMDLDDDDSTGYMEGPAPLPLIETTEVRPPLPPPLGDGFQPVPDQTTLSMTSSNVAWMPGYVESLETDVDTAVTIIGTSIQSTRKVVDRQSKIETDPSDSPKAHEKNDTDEKEVWALRAQALKSLACKRAAKAKKLNKEKVVPSPEKRIVAEKLAAAAVSSSKSLEIHSVSRPVLQTPIMSKSSEIVNKFVPPKHAPVIIQLGKEDFESDSSPSEELDCSQNSGLDNLKRETKQQKAKPIQKSRKSGDENLLRELQSNIERSASKMKKHSSYIVKDQLTYRKLQAEIAEKRTMFNKQSDNVKQLQEKLQNAMKEKAGTRKIHNMLHAQLKKVKDGLKDKISVRKNVDDEILRARSIVSVNRLKLNGKGMINDKTKQHISTLSRSLQNSYLRILKFEKMHGVPLENLPTESNQSSSDAEVTAKRSALLKTAADVKNMKKEDLAKLELELREKLKKYRSDRNLQDSQTTNTKEKELDDENCKLSVKGLSMVKSINDLKKLQNSLLANSQILHNPITRYNLLEELQERKPTSCTNLQIVAEDDAGSSNQNDTSSYVYPELSLCTKYRSVLAYFRSYRLSPYFRTQSKFNIQSPTFSNIIEAKKIMCKYDVLGTCNDGKCGYWHFHEKCHLPVDEVIKDLVAYDLRTFNGTLEMSSEAKRKLLESFSQQFSGQYSGKMSSDEKLLLLWNQLKESRLSRKETSYECINFIARDWLSLNKSVDQSSSEEMLVDQYCKQFNPLYFLKKKKQVNDAVQNSCYESQEVRYFSESYNSMQVLEAALSENPSDVKLWLALAHHHMKPSKTNRNHENYDADSENTSNVEKALTVLSQGLELNRDAEELWIQYLHLFANNSTADELRELCYQAVMYAATYNVWWTCLNLEQTYLGKQEICTEMIKFVVESDEAIEIKSHYLLETILYVTQLLTSRRKLATAINFVSAALGRDEFVDDVEKLQISDIYNFMSDADKSLLWICFISLQVFHSLPSCIFKDEDSCHGRLVNKEKFLLEWTSKPLNLDNTKIRLLFKAATESFGERSISTIKPLMIIHENLVAFELSLDNVKFTVSLLRSLVADESSFVEGCVLLLSLYIKYSPMDAVVTVAEEAIHKCEHDVEVVYLYTSWLYKKGMPTLAMEILTKCIHVYFQFDDMDNEIPDVLLLYRKVLGLPVPYTIGLPTYLPKTSQHLTFYYWLCFCLLLKIKKITPSLSTSTSATDEAFESAVHQYTSKHNTKKLWLAYLDHRIDYLLKLQRISAKDYHDLVDLLFRSLASVPASTVVLQNRNINWKDFSFHNKVLDLCLSVIPSEKRSKIYQKAIAFMPDNIHLACRICHHEFESGNYEQARIICGSLLQDFPRCLQLWRMAIQVELKCNCVKEARWLHQEATKALPFCSSLWKDYASFEIIYSSSPEKLSDVLEQIVSNALQHGVELKETLANIGPT